MIEELSPVTTRPVFLIGGMRSGTTLLCELLNAHPNLAIFCESFIFRTIYLLRGDFRRGNLDNIWHATRFIEFLFQTYNPYGHGWLPIFQFLDSPKVRAQLFNSDRSPRSLVAGVFSAPQLHRRCGVAAIGESRWVTDRNPACHNAHGLRAVR